MPRSDLLNKVLTFCIFLLCAVVSFFPEYVHVTYWAGITIFLVISLSFLMLDRECRGNLFQASDWPLWSLLVGLLSGVVTATDRNAAWDTYVHIAAAFFLLYYIGKGLFISPGYRIRAIYFICFSASIVILIAVLELCFQGNVIYEGFIPSPYYTRYIHAGRAMSTHSNPVILGSYLLATVPFSFYLWKQKPRAVRVWGIVLTVLSFGIILFTFSRGVFLGAIGLITAYLFLKGKKYLVLALFILVALFSVICSYSNNSNIERFGVVRLVAGSNDSIISPYRTERLQMTQRILKTSPLFGIGFQHFRIRFSEFCSASLKTTNFEFRIADNMYLTFLAETGLVGALSFLVFMVVILGRVLARFRRGDEEGSDLALILLTALVGLLVNMGAYEMFYWQNPLMLFALICGFTAGVEIRKT